ncbi:MAG: F0F1 ATP synthase subunit B [Bacteroidota bacterium]
MSLVLAADLLSYNAGLFVWIALAFGTMFVVLAKFAFPAIIGGLKEREQAIEDSLTRAERANAEAQTLLAQNDAARREAESQAQAILRDAREEATRQRESEVAKTKDDIARMRESAAADIEAQKQQALNELRSEVASLAVGAAEKILQKEIDASEQSALVDRFIADLPKN